MNDFKTFKDMRTQLRVGYICVALAITLAVCTLGCMSVVSSCKEGARYFSASATVTIFAIGIALSIALSFAALFVFKKEPFHLADSSDGYAKVARYSSALPALASLGIAVFALLDGIFGAWGNAVMILGAVASLYFILKLCDRFPIAAVISGFGVFALCTVIITSLYLDLTIELNSHFKLLVQFGAAGMILGTIADLRAKLSPKAPNGFKLSDRDFIKIGVKGFIFLKLLALTLCAVCASVIILYFAIGHSALGAHYLAYSLLYLAYAISSASELIGAVISVIKGHI